MPYKMMPIANAIMFVNRGTMAGNDFKYDIVKRPLLSKKRTRTGKTVEFNEEKNSFHYDTSSSSSSGDQTVEEQPKNTELWYQPSEIASFRKHFEKMFFSLQSCSRKEQEDRPDGPSRRRIKIQKQVIRYVVQSQGMGPDVLGLVSRQATRSARTIAYGQGMKDFFASYSVPEDVSVDNRCNRNKRSAMETCSNDDSRPVRRRRIESILDSALV